VSTGSWLPSCPSSLGLPGGGDPCVSSCFSPVSSCVCHGSLVLRVCAFCGVVSVLMLKLVLGQFLVVSPHSCPGVVGSVPAARPCPCATFCHSLCRIVLHGFLPTPRGGWCVSFLKLPSAFMTLGMGCNLTLSPPLASCLPDEAFGVWKSFASPCATSYRIYTHIPRLRSRAILAVSTNCRVWHIGDFMSSDLRQLVCPLSCCSACARFLWLGLLCFCICDL
jgi:hypothetical protein